MKRKLNRLQILYILILIIINLFLAIYSEPITDLGDGPTYIVLSKVFLGRADATLIHRSPLYSIVMAGFMLLFSPPFLFKIMIIMQFLLVGLSAWMLYIIFRPLFPNDKPAMSIGLMFNLSLSTIYFASIILTEILTVFLLIVSIYWLLKLQRGYSVKYLVYLGLFLGLLSLSRYNAIPLVIPVLLMLIYLMITQKLSIKKMSLSLLIIIMAYLVVINIWCFHNYKKYEFYGLFRGRSELPYNAIIATIRPENVVSDKNKDILRIFLQARNRYLAQSKSGLKGSLSGYTSQELSNDIYSGCAIYYLACNEFKDYFKMSDDFEHVKLQNALNGFYKEIYRQNRLYILRLQFISFFSGFRSSASALPIEYGKKNINILPAILIKLYKISVIGISFLVFITFFIFSYLMIKKRIKPEYLILLSYVIVFSFWGINFYFNTVNDANRFKFPAEPFIIGLFVYNIYKGLPSFFSTQTAHLPNIQTKP